VATIEIERSSITLADTAQIKLSLTNQSDSRVFYTPLGPADLVRLVVTRDGERLKPNATMRPTGGLQVPFAFIQPRQTFKLDGGEWMSITDFGYRLEAPGHYAILGIPHVPPMADTTTIRSNLASFEISPADDSARGPLTRVDSIKNEMRRKRGPPFYTEVCAVELSIETRKTTFIVGDSIDVRVTMRNGADHAVQFASTSTYLAAPLRIVDGEGRDVKLSMTFDPTSGGALKVLQPGQAMTFLSHAGSEWINLRDWGYDLKEPGSYAILGPREARTSITIGP
jgi:hypothetical protein